MKIKKVLIAALAAANVLSIGTGLILTAVGSSLAKSQGTNYAAQRWDAEGGSAQLSCFFTENAEFSTYSVPYITQTLTDKLKNAGVIVEEGQKLIPECVGKAAELKKIREEKGYSYVIEADGGINLQNYPALGEAGVDCSVMGSAVFGIEAGERNAKICSINGKEI